MKLQSFKYTDFVDDVYKLLERYSTNGSEVETGERIDIGKRFTSCANRVMRKLCSEFGMYRKKIRVDFEAPKLLCDYGSFELASDEIFSKKLSGRSLAYRLLAGGNGELAFIDCTDTASVSIRNGAGGISEYKGFITPNGDNSHFLLAATPKLRVYSFEIYSDFNGSEEELSLLGGKDTCILKLPEDFLRLSAVYDKNGKKVNTELFSISDDGENISISGKMAGVYTLEYVATYEMYYTTNTIRLPSMLYEALIYMCAAELCPSYDGDLYSRLTYKYREVLENYYDKERQLANGRNSFYGVVSKKFKDKIGKAGV